MAELNEITLDRAQRLLKTQAVSQAQLDTDAANLKNAKAQVAQQQAIIDKKILRAPFAGHLGIRAVDLGQYLGAGTPIVTLQALDPIYVDFYRPATVGRSGAARPTGGGEGRRLQRSDLCRRDFGGQSESRYQQSQRADPRDAEKSRITSCCRECTRRSISPSVRRRLT